MHIFIKMKKDIKQIIQVPEEVEMELKGNVIKFKGKEGELKRILNLGKIKISNKGKEITLECKNATKNEKRTINTFTAHINNMMQGVQKKFEYKLKIVFSHFPISVDIKGTDVIIKNFLGEKIERRTTIPKEVEIDAGKEIIIIRGIDKELTGQASANFEKATKIRNKDRRVFQDGIFLISKNGRAI